MRSIKSDSQAMYTTAIVVATVVMTWKEMDREKEGEVIQILYSCVKSSTKLKF